MSTTTPVQAEAVPEVCYPCEDGQPMAETPIHVMAIILLFEALQDFLRPRPDVYVAANMFWYWEEGNPKARRAPDVMAIKGVGQRERRSFFSWRENGAVPHVIVEIASEDTWREDLYDKCRLFAELGVAEYFLFDPESRYLRPSLQGFRLSPAGHYEPLAPDAEDRLRSEELGLFLKAEGAMLRLIDAATGTPIPTRLERAEALAAEVARLKALLEQAGKGNAPGGRE